LSAAKVDQQLPDDSRLRGQVAIASARVAYQRYLAKFVGPDWERLASIGAKPQWPLWASTGTKNPDYSDVLYVSELIGPDVVNTMPEQTLRAFADHGEVTATLATDPAGADRILAEAVVAGIDLPNVTDELERRRNRVVLRLLSPAARLRAIKARRVGALTRTRLGIRSSPLAAPLRGLIDGP
jgi:transaldolase